MGDALQSAAFEILTHPDTHDDAEIRCRLVHRLALASGAQGMAGGQMIDLLGARLATRKVDVRLGTEVTWIEAYRVHTGRTSQPAARCARP